MTLQRSSMDAMLQLLTLDIPQPQVHRPGFLDITEQRHKENVISNVYRYFLDQEASPLLSRLLLSSLVELIEQAYQNQRSETKKISLNEVKVFREYSTAKGRIDLVIEDFEEKSVVIIEAKIYFHLHNDLNDYWAAFSHPENNKAGIVLSLEPMATSQMNSENFISITHADWLNHARNKGLPHDLPIHDLIYFNDLVENMNQLIYSNTMNPEIEFYLTHATKINQAIATRQAALEFVVGQLQTVADYFHWTLYGRTEDWRQLWDESQQATIYYVVLPSEILAQQGRFRVILELYSQAMPYEAALRTHFGAELEKVGWKAMQNELKHVVHFYEKNYSISPDTMATMADVLIKDLEENLEPVRKKMMTWLEEKGAHANA